MLLQCSYPCKFPASSIFSSAGWRYPVGTRSRFRWKLHPSSQAWPLLSTSNHGETAIAKCGNSPETGEFPAQRASNAENVSIWWRHHAPHPGHPGCPPFYLRLSYRYQDNMLHMFIVMINAPNECYLILYNQYSNSSELTLINALWFSDDIWWNKCGSTLAKVRVCCTTTPSQYLNQCWLISKNYVGFTREQFQGECKSYYSI